MQENRIVVGFQAEVQDFSTKFWPLKHKIHVVISQWHMTMSPVTLFYKIRFKKTLTFIDTWWIYYNIYNMLAWQPLETFIARNQSAKALVTQGEGKFYSNGLDLPWFNFLQETDSDIRDTFSRQKFMMVVIRILTFPLPTIALINGRSTKVYVHVIQALYHIE